MREHFNETLIQRSKERQQVLCSLQTELRDLVNKTKKMFKYNMSGYSSAPTPSQPCLCLFVYEIANSLEKAPQLVVMAGMRIAVRVICSVCVVLFGSGQTPVLIAGLAVCACVISPTVAYWPLWCIGRTKPPALSIMVPVPGLSCHSI